MNGSLFAIHHQISRSIENRTFAVDKKSYSSCSLSRASERTSLDINIYNVSVAVGIAAGCHDTWIYKSIFMSPQMLRLHLAISLNRLVYCFNTC